MSGAKMQLEDWLDDLCVRFIINLPQEDLSSVPRICFQVEEAQWFYEDFIRPLDPTLPSMTLRTFCLRIFQHCPLLTTFPVGAHIQAFEEFLQYKTRIPVRGAILLNEAMDSVILVRGWKKNANWSFPRGKINKDEDDLDCAIREVYEETGFDVRAAGLVPAGEATKSIEVTMRDQQIRLYVFRDVPMDTHFEPRTRKEISKIQWYHLSELPAFRKKGNHDNPAGNATNANKFYMVAPFLVPLKKWISQQLKQDASRSRKEAHPIPDTVPEETATEDETWNQPQPGQPGPDPGALEGATRELQRLLKIQPPTQGIQPPSQPVSQPVSQPASEQDKGGALLALLQSKTPATNQYPLNPAGHTNTESAQPRPHHDTTNHPAHQPPLAPQEYSPQPFPVPPGAGHGPWTGGQQANVPQVQGVRHPHAQNGYPQHYPNPPPALVHPQPLPPQVHKTGVFNYTTPPPHTLLKAPAGPHDPYQNVPPHGYPREQQNQIKQYGPPLNEHSKALLDAFKTRASPGSVQEPIELPASQPVSQPSSQSQQPSKLNAPHVQPYPGQGKVPDIAAAARPYQNAGVDPNLPMGIPAPNQLPPSAFAPKAQAQSDKHRSALLGMFKQTESNASVSPRETTFPTLAGGSTSNSKPNSLAGASPHVPLANLSLQGQPGSPSSRAYPSPGRYTSEIAAPKTSQGPSTGSSQPLMQLLRRQEEPPKPQRAPPAPYAVYDPAQTTPTALGSPPAPASFPAPVFHRQQEAPAGHKKKLLSLFSPQQQMSTPAENEEGSARKTAETAEGSLEVNEESVAIAPQQPPINLIGYRSLLTGLWTLK
ncbi:related to decapping enzyme [Cephalotrichum gorgonifer]|uniref:Related to decapping enzyme n=1 Tax=Cephalotrichum gorgonifer TaxID=2041049 RepID=A0AAE8MWB7_9PEZI|nr:related to decapping enzyme [Cephalotrichum gorgonifer]